MTISLLSWRVRLPRWLLIGAIVLALLVLSALIGALLGEGRTTLALLLIAAPLGLAGVAFAARYFEFTVLQLPLITLLVPFTLPTGTGTSLPANLLAMALLTGIWVAGMYARRSWRLRPSPLNRPLLLFGAICCASLFWGMAWRDPLVYAAPNFLPVQIASLVTYLLSIGAALLIGNFVSTRRQLAYIVGVFVVTLSAMALIHYFAISQDWLIISGLWSLWLVALAYGLLIAQPRLKLRWRAALLVILAMTFYQTMVVDAYWVSGWLPGAVALAAITLLHSRKGFLILLLLAALLYRPVISPYLQEQIETNEEEGASGRLTLWEINFELVRSHWLLGTGPAGYAVYYMTYHPDGAHSTHNNYVDIAAQFGLLGLLAWLWLAVAGVVEGWRLIRRAPPGLLRTVALVATGGWVGALAAMMLGDWVLPFAYNVSIVGFKHTIYTWIFLGTLIAVRSLLDAQPAAGPAPPEPL